MADLSIPPARSAHRLAVVGGRGSAPHAAGRGGARCWWARPAPPARSTWWRGGRWRPASVALALQVGTNFANDYSDGVRGTDDPGSAGRPRAPGRLGAAAAGRREAGGAAVVPRWRASRVWRWRSRSAPSFSSSAPPPSRPAGSTRAARTRTATTASASCSSSCSSGWWRRSGSTYVQTESLTALSARGVGAGRPAGDGAARRSTTSATSRATPSRASGPSPCASATPHPLALRRHARRGLHRRAGRGGRLRPARPPLALVGVVLARGPVLRVLEGARARRSSRCSAPPGGSSSSPAPRCSARLGSLAQRLSSRAKARCGRVEPWAASQGWRIARKASGCSRWAAWPAPSTRASVALAPISPAMRSAEGGELVVVLARHHEHRHRRAGGRRCQERVLRAGAGLLAGST